MDRHEIGTPIVIRRRGRHLVVVRPVILVAAEHRDAGGIRILPRLRDPKATALVEAEVERLRDRRFVQHEIGLQVRRGCHLLRGFKRRLPRPGHLRGTAQHAVGFTEGIKRRDGRFHRDRRTRLIVVARAKLPSPRKHALHEIIHDERRVAEEALRAGAGRVVHVDRQLVPLALAQRADGNLVPVDRRATAAVIRRKRPTGAELHAVDPYLVRAGQVADIHPDRLFVKVPLMLDKETIVDLHPRAVPRGPACRRCRLQLDRVARTGHGDSRPIRGAQHGAQDGNGEAE